MPSPDSACFFPQFLPLLAIGADLLFGDPEWAWHPARLAGRLALRLEQPARSVLRNETLAGCAAAAGTILALTIPAALGVLLLQGISYWLGFLAAVFLVYTTVALRDMCAHSQAVLDALSAENLELARQKVSRIVGRDTAQLPEPEIVRATVESVAESSCDGIAAPVFYAALGALLAGAPGAAAFAIAYRAANTLDSTFGYKNERYLHFGWASARFDDLLNYLPARLNAFVVCLVARVSELFGTEGKTEYYGRNAWSILRRDGRKHASPNSGLGEAVYAGALGIQLGGLNYYQGQPSEGKQIGEALEPLKRDHIRQANDLLVASTFLLALALWAAALLLSGLCAA